MNIFENLKPEKVWMYFDEILQIPRPSKKEEKIIAYLLDFGKKHNLPAKRDEIGNVLITKPATKGYENQQVMVLQSHIDMVCEKNADVVHDFEKDPIKAKIEGEWVTAEGTTLGADDGIGIAAQLAILAANNIEHGPIECLFTVDEETGLSGAFALQPEFMTGKILLNLDSEDEGELFIGCAGGIDTMITLTYKKRKTPPKHNAYLISVKGLLGGHSGDEINKGHGNSNKILNRLLWNLANLYKIRLNNFDGGNLRNAIPREAFAIITVNSKHKKLLEKYCKKYFKTIKNELSETDAGVQISIEKTETPKFVINKSAQQKLLNALYACPHGVIAMSYRMPGMVETSTNLASVKFKDDNIIEITTSQRSDLNSSKLDIASMVESVFLLAECNVKHGDGYPGWTPNPNSEILKITVAAYEKLFGNTPVVRSIHAGLECGLFLEKYPEMDMISFGPTLRQVHSPDEKINIETVDKFWKLLLEVLKNAPLK